MGRLTAVLLLAIAAVISVSAAVFVRLVSPTPTVGTMPAPSPEAAARARDIVREVNDALKSGDEIHRLTFSQSDLDGLAALAARGVSGLSGRAVIEAGGVVIEASVPIPETPVGSYVNIRLDIAASADGLRIERLGVGAWGVPGGFVDWFVRTTLNNLESEQRWGDVAFDVIRSVDVGGGTLRIAYGVGRETLARAGESVKAAIQEAALLGDAKIVRLYYAELLRFGRDKAPRGSASLSRYLKPVFRLARNRSAAGGAAEENQAAILALAMYCGTTRIERLIGDVRTPQMKEGKRVCHERARLGGRQDLMLHFVYSAAIRIASDAGLTFAVGEFKELLDATGGGSGFSFTDLAADLAGDRFAGFATDPEHAQRAQMRMSGDAGERFFFPDIAGLPEGLTKREFEQRFGSPDSAAYRSVVTKIERRVGALNLYAMSAGG